MAGGIGRLTALFLAAVTLAGCDGVRRALSPSPPAGTTTAAASGSVTDSGDSAQDVTATDATATPRATAGVRDDEVEAPQILQFTDTALWDGRPSLGGIWVASADVTAPERVVLRNAKTGKAVAGALFRRARNSSGPKLQLSSEAAAALGLLAGQPAELRVTALRRGEPKPARTGTGTGTGNTGTGTGTGTGKISSTKAVSPQTAQQPVRPPARPTARSSSQIE